MKREHIKLSGQMPHNYQQALALLEADLGYVPGEKGLSIHCTQTQELSVVSDGVTVELGWQTPVQFYRALSLIPRPLAPCDIHEQARFQSVGPMIDCSRNAVLTPETIRFLLRKMALMGLNLGMVYTEDTYEVPEQPFFGYKRGRYTFAELKALDDYADVLGIELCPCIQTLGHLKQILHWPAFQSYRDNEEILLADEEKTYELLEQMIRAASAPYRSKKIHLGMDEAFGVGLGVHLQRFGYEDPHAIMGRHLSRVLEITDKYGLEAMMWSDMYFQLDGHSYYSPEMPSESSIKAVDPRVTLVYWDYYHSSEQDYDTMLQKHALFDVPTVFAGGLWNWYGPAIDYPVAIANTVPALKSCMKANIPLVLATMWGDDGAESSILSTLLGLQIYAEMTYQGDYDARQVADRFARCCNADAQAFLDISLLNVVPGIVSNSARPSNACKILLYQDPLVQLFEEDTKGLQMASYFSDLVPKYAQYARENPEYHLLFDFCAALALAVSLKCSWHEKAADTVRSGDRTTAAVLADDLRAAIDAVDALRVTWRALWESTNKPQGFEVIDVRLGGVCARLSTAGEKMRAFAEGQVDDIPELTEQSLLYKRNPDNTFGWINTMAEIATPSKIDF